MKFPSPEVAQYLYKSTIRSYIKYCCHAWAGAPSCYLELLDKLQKSICRTAGPSVAASLELLVHSRNGLSLFYRYKTLVYVDLNWLHFSTVLFLREVYSLF